MLDRETILKVATECYPESARATKLFAEVGQRVRDSGCLELEELVKIANWKSYLAGHHTKGNGNEVVRDLTRKAFEQADAGQVTSAVRTLVWDGSAGLRGVRTRMASTILTVYDPKRYIVMDVRALASLTRHGLEDLSPPLRADAWLALNEPATYEGYLLACRNLNADLGINDLRALDRCLWALAGRTVQEMRDEECIQEGKPFCGRHDAEDCPCAHVCAGGAESD